MRLEIDAVKNFRLGGEEAKWAPGVQMNNQTVRDKY